jgi:diadenosine tetraphosphatase ApaH/serine/threonine PP2A family protein phosphatase
MHGSPLDEDEYMVSAYHLRQALPYLDNALSFAGHTHAQGGFLWPSNGDSQIPQTPVNATEFNFEIPANCFCLCNPGSVGQPRDGDPRAAYLLYSPEDKVVSYRRVVYDIAAAQRKILDAGLPARLAARLAAGQ